MNKQKTDMALFERCRRILDRYDDLTEGQKKTAFKYLMLAKSSCLLSDEFSFYISDFFQKRAIVGMESYYGNLGQNLAYQSYTSMTPYQLQQQGMENYYKPQCR